MHSQEIHLSYCWICAGQNKGQDSADGAVPVGVKGLDLAEEDGENESEV